METAYLLWIANLRMIASMNGCFKNFDVCPLLSCRHSASCALISFSALFSRISLQSCMRLSTSHYLLWSFWLSSESLLVMAVSLFFFYQLLYYLTLLAFLMACTNECYAT